MQRSVGGCGGGGGGGRGGEMKTGAGPARARPVVNFPAVVGVCSQFL
eukprot:SAG11_NODE_570_length_8454_cov_19.886655_1_plen_46_part_10